VTAEGERDELVARIDRLESRERIATLAADYCSGLDRGNESRFLGIWHRQAVYEPPGDRGLCQTGDDFRRYFAQVGRAWHSTHHWNTNHVITFVSTERATGRSDALAVCITHAGEPRLISATYHDEYRRDAGAWTISHRRVEQWFVSDALPIVIPM
jgi:hypothetical protein